MTEQELRQFVDQLRQQQRDQVQTKREREQSDDTMVNEDELQWTGSRPCPKRLRAMPTANDEVVDLDD